jgi:hypothetical protein
VAEHPPAPDSEGERSPELRDVGGATFRRFSVRRQALALVRGQQTSELVDEMTATLGMSRATAFRFLGAFERTGYIARRRQGRILSNWLTDDGRRKLASKNAVFGLVRRRELSV